MRFLTIAGSIGAVRLASVALVLTMLGTGATAANWFNRDIPTDAHQAMGLLGPEGITTFAFAPNGGWVMATQQGSYLASGIPDECFSKLGEFIENGARIYCVAFPPEGGNRWVITTDRGIFARNIPDECYDTILAYLEQGREIRHVAFPPEGGNRWVIVTDTGFSFRNVDDECYQMTRNIVQGGRRVTRVVFDQGDGWVVVAEDEFFARRIDSECFDTLVAFANDGWRLHNVAFSPKRGGWSVYSRLIGRPLPYDPVRKFEQSFPSDRGGSQDVWAALAQHRSPGLTIAFVRNDEIDWMCGYGFLEAGDPTHAAHPECRFQVASLSKPVTSLGVGRLVIDTPGLGPNSDIRSHLGWALPMRDCIDVFYPPTVVSVMGHRGGIIGRDTTAPLDVCSGFDDGGGGFAGYGPSDTVPSLLDVLNGNGTNSPAFEITHQPQIGFSYSGAGFVLLQRMIEWKSGLTFARYMQDKVLLPIGMDQSTFDRQLSPTWIAQGLVASGHDANGAVIPGQRRTYPESAAAGLYSSARDFARLMIYLNKRYRGEPAFGPLGSAAIQSILTQGPVPGWGLGFVLSNVGTNDFSYSHGGVNAGFRARFRGWPERGFGVVMLMNGENDELLDDAFAALQSCVCALSF